MPSPTLRVKVNGGASTALPLEVSNSDVLQFVLSSTSGISSVEWRIYSYPDGFDPGAGWTEGASGWVCYDVAGSEDCTLPASGFDTWLVTAICRDDDGGTLYELTGAVYILSANGLRQVAYQEESEVDTTRQWLEPIRAAIESLDGTLTDLVILDYKSSVRCATTANITLSGSQTIDGITPSSGNRVLVKDQSTAANNGIYVYNASGAWTRATDADADAEVTSGMVVYVEQGTTNGKKLFRLETANPIVVGMTSLTFTEISGSGGSLSGASGTVYAGTGGSAAFTATPTVTSITSGALIDTTNPASAGFVRLANASSITARNNTNSADWTVFTSDTKLKFGSTTGPAISLLTASNVAIGDSTIWVTVDVDGVTLEGNSSTSLYGGDNAGNPYKLVSATDENMYLGDSVGDVVAKVGGTSTFGVIDAGVYSMRVSLDGDITVSFGGGSSYGQNVVVAPYANPSGNGAELSISGGSSGGSNGDGGNLVLGAGQKNGSGVDGKIFGYVAGQERLVLSYGVSAWQRFGPLWILEIDLSLIANTGASSEITVANPADHFVISALWTMRLSTGITGGTSTITGGISSGGTEVIASTVWNSGTGANTTVQGGPTDADSKVGSTYLLGWDGYKFTSATTLYFKAAASGSNVTAGTATIKLFGREF